MLKVKELCSFNWEGAIRGMRNPMNSWDRSDSSKLVNPDTFILGSADLELGLKLCKSGAEHRKFLRQVFISCDIIAPDYWWKEYATYKVGTVENSTSTMHKLCSRELTVDDFSIDEKDNFIDNLINHLNTLISEYVLTKDKKVWRKLIQTLPMSYNYHRTCSLNYEILANMYHQRKAHKLIEWEQFFTFMEKLPYKNLWKI